MSELISTYQNGETVVSLYSDGTKVRDISNGTRADYPESMDVKITNFCVGANCKFCHENSTPRGLHADLQPTIDLLKQLPRGAEVAIGGGHAMSHPEFDSFVKELSESGIICNVTLNEFHFLKELPRIERLVADKHIYGVGYSYQTIPCTWKYEHLVTHVINGVTPYASLSSIVKVNPKVLLLGFKKNTGRGFAYNLNPSNLVDAVIKTWYINLFSAAKEAHLSFDNLAIEQLQPRRLFPNKADYDKFYMGKDGCYSMYMDAVKQEFSVSSTGIERFGYGTDLKEMFGRV